MQKIALYTALATLFLFSAVSLLASYITPYDPFAQDLLSSLTGPDMNHWMGRDLLGRDILSRVILGSRVSLVVGFSVTAISLLTGVLVGGVAGAFGGKTDEAIMRIIDILLAFPGLLMAIAVMAVLGPGVTNVIIALCISGWTGFARITRAQILSLREREYVLAARALGQNNFRIIYSHFIPNSMAPLIIEATFGMAAVIAAEAGLSFLGL
ncbi:MAG: ABC transporter permease, partial [Nitrospinota bacterium]